MIVARYQNHLLQALVGMPLLAAILLTGCISGDDDDATATPESGDANLELTASDNGGSFDVAVDEEITITLPANPSTGYEWAVAEVNGAILNYQGSDYVGPTGDAVGAGGDDILRFRAVREGTSAIELKYWQSWEGDSSVSDTFMVTINVQ